MTCFLGFSNLFVLLFNPYFRLVALCVYVQSESWQRPLSARKQIIPTSTRSLRSATRLIDNGITSLPRCSQPQISNSRVHSSATDDIKQLDVSANTVNSVRNKYVSYAHILHL